MNGIKNVTHLVACEMQREKNLFLRLVDENMERFMHTNRDFIVDSAIQIPFGNQRGNGIKNAYTHTHDTHWQRTFEFSLIV